MDKYNEKIQREITREGARTETMTVGTLVGEAGSSAHWYSEKDRHGPVLIIQSKGKKTRIIISLLFQFQSRTALRMGGREDVVSSAEEAVAEAEASLLRYRADRAFRNE